jgi:hypothetical protein
MRTMLGAAFVVLLFAMALAAQEKGIDSQTNQIRSTSTGATNGSGNGINSGMGRGVNWGKGKTVVHPLRQNPYAFSGRKDVIVQAVQDVLVQRKLVLDDAASRLGDGVLISQPFTFSKGAVVTQGELGRYSDLPDTSSRSWTRGRYTLIVEVQPLDGVRTNVSVSARIEGRTDNITGAEWVTLHSNGTVEDEFLAALIARITGEVQEDTQTVP